MKKLWLTYAWVDNENDDVDAVVTALRGQGVEVRLDRTHLVAGLPLWPQIGKHIADPGETDGWAIYATLNSLTSNPCKEELNYALDHALNTRGVDYPLIGIFPEPIHPSLVPPAIRTRRFVSLQDPDWQHRIVGALEGKPGGSVADTALVQMIRHDDGKGKQIVIEVQLKAGRWYPSKVLLLAAEIDRLQVAAVGPKGVPPLAVAASIRKVSGNGLAGLELGEAVDNLNSLYLYFSMLPSLVHVGQSKGKLYRIDFGGA